jgi:phosphoribosylformylglycinamidine synthase I
MRPNVLILHANGTNRDHDAAQAVELAGGSPEIVHLNLLRHGIKKWPEYQMLVIPGGFSYADALGAGKLLALDLKLYFADEVRTFVESGKPVIGICNGFQALVKSGILPDQGSIPDKGSIPDPAYKNGTPLATLTNNASGHFECRWVTLLPRSQKCIWTRSLEGPITCPVAHGEGNFVCAGDEIQTDLIGKDQLALVYAGPDGLPAGGSYPYNPNGSVADIAGICNPAGNVLGLMPHPEDHIFPRQHPHWPAGEHAGSGLPLFINGIRYSAQL